MKYSLFLIVFVLFIVPFHEALAQGDLPAVTSVEVADVQSEPEPEPEPKPKPKVDPIKKTYDLNTIPSLFFTFWQHEAIQDAKRDRLLNASVRPPSQEELDAMDRGELYESQQEFVREIVLGGIAYNSDEDWTIWLNEQRITPKAVPSEILALKVYKDYIELKWIDRKTNNVYPIRLRPHQRFNLDLRMFLMGE